MITVRALRRTQYATPAILVEQHVDEGEASLYLEVVADDELRLPEHVGDADTGALAAVDGWLTAHGYARSTDWLAEPAQFSAELAAPS